MKLVAHFTVFTVVFMFCTPDVSCLEVKISPPAISALSKSEVTIHCSTTNKEPIKSCQFMIYYVGIQKEGPVMNVDNCSYNETIINPYATEPSNYTAKYTRCGKFKDGSCGVKLNSLAGGQLLAGCKLTTESNITAVKTAPLYFYTEDTPVELENNISLTVARPGDKVDVAFQKSGKTLSKCKSKLVSQNTLEVISTGLYFNGFKTADDKSRYSLINTNLTSGKCGFAINKVKEEDNGPIYLLAEVEKGATSAQVFTTIVSASPVAEPVLVLDKDEDAYMAGDVITATCTVKGVRQPDVEWEWKLGSEIVGEDYAQDYSNAYWSWPWQKANISQSRTFQLSDFDDGKSISCTVKTALNAAGVSAKSSTLVVKKPTTPAATTPPPEVPSSSATVNPTATDNTTVNSDNNEDTPPISGEVEGSVAKSGKDNSEAPTAAPPDGLAWQLTIEPPECVTFDSKHINILCKAPPGIKLAGCGFQIAPKDGEHYFNASMGHMTKTDAGLGKFSVKYYGKGLDEGECGIELTAPDKYQEETFLVGCRARTGRSGWKYNYTAVVESTSHPKKTVVVTEPTGGFLLPGSNLKMQCNTENGESMKKCSITLPGTEAFDINEDYQAKSPSFHRYSGSGLAQGHCGIFIANVTQLNATVDNRLSCELMIGRKKYYTREIRINIAEAPSKGATVSVTPSNYSAGSELSVKCVVPGARPPANIGWFRRGEPVPSAEVREAPVDRWRWRTDAEATTQFLSMTLEEGDDGGVITCVVSHMAWKEPKNTSVVIAFDKATTSSFSSGNTANTPTDGASIQPTTSSTPGGDVGRGDHDSNVVVVVVVGAVLGVLLLLAVVAGVAVAAVKKLACFKARESEATSLRPAHVEAGRTAPAQQGRAPTQRVQPLRQRRPTPPEQRELQQLRRGAAGAGDDDDDYEKVQYAEIRRPAGVATPKPKPPPTSDDDDVLYAELDWQR